MKNYSLQLRGFRILLSTLLLFLIVMMATESARSQNNPKVPVLSLTGPNQDYLTDWYPDGRIWLPVGQGNGATREFLMPVFMDNKWWHYKSTDRAKYLAPDPIYSFKFKILFDGTALNPVDIVTVHPFPEDDARGINANGDFIDPLAKDFNINWDVHNDMNYKTYFVDPINPVEVPLREREKGKVIIITGTSGMPLPVTDTLRPDDFSVLLYVKFRVKLSGILNDDERSSLSQPIYISPDTIMYNDWNVREEIAFKELLYSKDIKIEDLYKDPKVFTPTDPFSYVGISGMGNYNVTSLWNTKPILPGTIYLQLTEDIPEIGYSISRTGSQPPIHDWYNRADLVDEANWVMRDPLTVDSGRVHKPDYVYGEVRFALRNIQSYTRLIDIDVESDSPWLLFELESIDRSKYWPVNQLTTKGYIYYIDNGTLGEGSDKPDPIGNETDPDEVMWVNIKCDPTQVVPHSGELAGVYVGYITFKSHTAEFSPIRLKVTFINFRNPLEPSDGSDDGLQQRGINLTVQNSKGTVGQSTNLVFGLGHRATDGVDELFGEFAHQSSMNGFGARFYHPDAQFRRDNNIENGFGDMLPNAENPFSTSRDIRNVNDSNESHIFLCRFNADGVDNYPVSIKWDVLDFPEDAQLFISDTLNGSIFPSVNMRKGTHDNGTIYSFSIQDPSITSFKIEYTPAKTIEYVEPGGEPKIKKGWNLLSMPVRSKNKVWNIVYPNAVNRPFSYYNSDYQDEQELRVGVGYFIKYSDFIDTRFKGVAMRRITETRDDDGFEDPVHIYPGWNTIGALTYPLSYQNIEFDEINDDKPTRNFVRQHGIWGFESNSGYYEAAVLEPGLGYWLKADPEKHGYLKLIYSKERSSIMQAEVNYNKINILNNSMTLLIRDNAQHEAKLYIANDKDINTEIFELPPLPPEGLFDARFYTNRIVETNNSTVIKLQGIGYPVSISIDNADANYIFIDAVTEEVLGNIVRGESKNIEIDNTVGNSIRVLKSDIVTDGLTFMVQPNPVVNSATIKYSVLEAGFVSLKLYDAIGNEILLEEGIKTAGEFEYSLNSSKIPSGSYICKMFAGTKTATIMINVVK